MTDTDEEFIQMLERFHEGDAQALLVIDEFNRIELIKELRADYNFFVVFLHPGAIHTDSRKGIYLHNSFDESAKTFIKDNYSTVVFFE